MLILFFLAGQISSMASADLVDLNRATLEEIYALPIDSAQAYQIYIQRETLGPFTSVYELRRVPGIDAVTFERIKPLVKIAVVFPLRSEWASIIEEQKKLASEEPPAKAAIDEWEDLIRSPMNINKADFDDLLMIDRMTPIDAAAVMRHRQIRDINSARDLRQVRGLSHYAYVSLRKYVAFEDTPSPVRPIASVRLKIDNENRLDTGEDDNLATRISHLEGAINAFDTTSLDLKNAYAWTDEQCQDLYDRLVAECDSLKALRPDPVISTRLRINYQKRLRIGLIHKAGEKSTKGYAGIAGLGPVKRFYLGNYQVVWGEGLMIDNGDEYRARIYSRSVGIFGDLTPDSNYDLFGGAGTLNLPLAGWLVKPSFFYSNTNRDALVNPDNTIWRILPVPSQSIPFKDRVAEQTFGANLILAPFERINPGTQFGLEFLDLHYDLPLDPDPRWIDLPLDKYDPLFYPEITGLSKNGDRRYYGATFLVPINNFFVSGEMVRQDDGGDPAYAWLIKGRIQYEYFYLNLLLRHYDIGYDNPFNRGFSEYRRFEDTPFERPYGLVDPEYIAIYDDPVPKPEEGVFLETRYQLTRNITLTRVYLDLFKNLSHNLVNQRAYFEIEVQPVWPVRIRYSQKYIKKYLARPALSTPSLTSESTIKVFFYLTDYDALRVETRFGSVGLTAVEGEDLDLTGQYLAFSYEHNFITGFSVEGGLVIWQTAGMSQWIFEDVGIDFLDGQGMKYYVVAAQRIGDILARLKFRQKFTDLAHNGLYNNDGIYYPDLPGVRVDDFTDHENSTKVSLQFDYLF